MSDNKLINSLSAYLETLELSGVSELMLKSVSHELNKIEQIAPEVKSGFKISNKESLVEIQKAVSGCVKCGELCGIRTQTVFGSGNAKAELVFVGEAPGFEEDKQGLPFVGKAGQLLTKMIEGIKLSRNEVFICNVLKCRPPENRNPKPDEIENCIPYLWAQLDIIKPKLICALGNFASQTLLKTTKTISQLRGNIHESNGYRILCTFHPAYLLRNPDDKKKAWEDLKRLRSELDQSTQ